MWDRKQRESVGRKLGVLNCFDPWCNPLCTCGPKLSLDPYNGCGFECFYCYASGYTWRYWGRDKVRPKQRFTARLRRDLERITTATKPPLSTLQGMWVAISNSSDPYPDTEHADEQKLGLTRSAIELLSAHGMRLLLQTKSDLFVRDLDIMPAGRTVIGVTVTTLDAALAARMEPWAPSPQRRLAAIKQAVGAGFPTLARVDPLIPGLNAEPKALKSLLEALAAVGVGHVVSSTLKLQPRSRARFTAAFGECFSATAAMYSEKHGHGNYMQLPRSRRREMILTLGAMARDLGMTFAVCREGLPECKTAACDGREAAPGRTT